MNWALGRTMNEYVFIIQEYEQKAREAFEGGEKLLLFGPSLVITALNIVLPLIFDFLSRFEDWSPGFEVNITLFR